jgi:hypothetical protein
MIQKNTRNYLKKKKKKSPFDMNQKKMLLNINDHNCLKQRILLQKWQGYLNTKK